MDQRQEYSAMVEEVISLVNNKDNIRLHVYELADIVALATIFLKR